MKSAELRCRSQVGGVAAAAQTATQQLKQKLALAVIMPKISFTVVL